MLTMQVARVAAAMDTSQARMLDMGICMTIFGLRRFPAMLGSKKMMDN